MVKKTIGKNTLGDSNKMKVAMRDYERSAHNLSYIWRNTQAPGTLVPCMKILATPGTTYKIKANSHILTHPTVGPLFGSYKFQMDIFTAPIRLYNALLHNNALNVGLDMAKVKFPKFAITLGKDSSKTPWSSSSLLAYLGFRNKGREFSDSLDFVHKFNAVPPIAYYDIFKNYFANKQEEKAYYIGGLEKAADSITIMPSNGDATTYTLKGIEWIQTDKKLEQTTQLRVNNLNNQVTPKQFWENLELRLSKDGVLGSRIATTQTSDASGATITLDKAESGTFNRITGIREAIEWDFEGVQLLPFKLENVDLMRDKILQTPGNNTLSITESDLEPYGALKRTFVSDFQQFGLCVKTYD